MHWNIETCQFKKAAQKKIEAATQWVEQVLPKVFRMNYASL